MQKFDKKKWKQQVRYGSYTTKITKWCEEALGPRGEAWDVLYLECSTIYGFIDDETFVFFNLRWAVNKIKEDYDYDEEDDSEDD